MSWIEDNLRQAISSWDEEDIAKLKGYYDKKLFKNALNYLRLLLSDFKVSGGDERIDKIILSMRERGEEMTQENLLRHLPT